MKNKSNKINVYRFTILALLAISLTVQYSYSNPPYIPIDLTCAFNNITHEVTLTWKQPKTIPTGYKIYRDHEVIDSIEHDGSDLYTFTTTLTEYGIFAFYVRAYNDDGESDIRINSPVTWLDPDGQASSLRQWGITWTFDTEVQFGQFANGDFWVIGPVNCISINPACDTAPDGSIINGSMIDPYIRTGDHRQGFDSRQRNYHDSLNDGLNISLSSPLTLNSGHSLVSTRSYYPRTYNRYIRTAAVLTVLDAPPSAGSFRPSYASKDKSILHTTAEMDLSFLPSLPVIKDAPNINGDRSRINKVFLDIAGSDFDMEGLATPFENMERYGRDVSDILEDVVLALCLDYPADAKKRLAINLVQMGLDLYGVIQASPEATWNGWGGHFLGRKFPVFFAGIALDDENIQNVKSNYPNLLFAEDDIMYYYNDDRLPEELKGKYSWTGSKILYKFNYHWDDPKYEAIYEHLHPTEWTIDGDLVPYIDDNLCESYRTCCTAKYFAGVALALRLMGLMEEWDNPAFFDYVDRWVHEDMTHFLPISNEATGSARELREYSVIGNISTKAVWEAYRNFSDTESPDTPANVAIYDMMDGSKKLTWDACGDNIGCVGYKIYRDGNILDTVYASQSWVDDEINSTTNYQVEAFDCFGNSTSAVNAVYGGTGIILKEIAYGFRFYPNPFSGIATITYTVPYNKESVQNPVRIIIYDQLGCEIAVLVDEEGLAGQHEVVFDASHLVAGVYFCRLSAGYYSIVKKMIISY